MNAVVCSVIRYSVTLVGESNRLVAILAPAEHDRGATLALCSPSISHNIALTFCLHFFSCSLTYSSFRL
ncbi:unnamed protein product [Tenebrio molitor]|nr:unnamed protein product [Tenebrio molitor]